MHDKELGVTGPDVQPSLLLLLQIRQTGASLRVVSLMSLLLVVLSKIVNDKSRRTSRSNNERKSVREGWVAVVVVVGRARDG